MKRPLLPLAITGILLGVVLGLILWIRAPRPVELPALAAATPRTTPAPTPEPAAEPAPLESAPVAASPPPGAVPPITQPLPISDAAAQALVARFDEIYQRAEDARPLLQKYIDADPLLSRVREAELQALAQTYMWIELSRALDDPVLRPVILRVLQPRLDGSPTSDAIFAPSIDTAAKRFGIKPAFTSGDPIAQTAAQLKALEPHYQGQYARLLEELHISEEAARLNEAVQQRNTLGNYIASYMKRYGYRYVPRDRAFERVGPTPPSR